MYVCVCVCVCISIYIYIYDYICVYRLFKLGFQHRAKWGCQDPKDRGLASYKEIYLKGIYSLTQALYVVGTSNLASCYGHWTCYSHINIKHFPRKKNSSSSTSRLPQGDPSVSCRDSISSCSRCTAPLSWLRKCCASISACRCSSRPWWFEEVGVPWGVPKMGIPQ